MSFRDDSQLDPSEVRDERGRGGLGGGFGGGRIAAGGGGLGIGVIIVILLLQVLGGGGGLGQLGSLQDQTASGPPAGDLSECRTGADANARQDCRIVGYVNSVQRFWKDEFARVVLEGGIIGEKYPGFEMRGPRFAVVGDRQRTRGGKR